MLYIDTVSDWTAGSQSEAQQSTIDLLFCRTSKKVPAQRGLPSVRAQSSMIRGRRLYRVAQLEAVTRRQTVPGNMAFENEGAVFNRWPISHEPLRADVEFPPVIDAASSIAPK